MFEDPHEHRTQTQWRGLWCLEMKPIQSLVSQVSGQTATQHHSLELREPLSSDTIENRPNMLSKKVFLEWNFCIRTHLAAKANLVIDTTTLWAVWLGLQWICQPNHMYTSLEILHLAWTLKNVFKSTPVRVHTIILLI